MILTPLIAMIPFYALASKVVPPDTGKPAAQADKPILLTHIFKKGEKMEYEVKAGIHEESRQIGLDTWIPDEEDFVYKFSMEVVELKADGVAVVRYLRPTFTQIAGQTADSGPKSKVDKVNEEMLVTLSPVNEVLSIKDKTKKKPSSGGDSGGGDQGGGQGNGTGAGVRPPKRTLFLAGHPQAEQLESFVVGLTGGLYDMVLLLGQIDLTPTLPWVAVTPGYTWKVTGGRSPQLLPESGGKMAEQRIDFTYTYVGPVTVSGKRCLRVHAELTLDTDLGKYLLQLMNVKPDHTDLKAMPFNLKSQIDFDLDPETRRTIRAATSGSGSANVMVKEYETPLEELKMDGSTKMTLLSVKP